MNAGALSSSLGLWPDHEGRVSLDNCIFVSPDDVVGIDTHKAMQTTALYAGSFDPFTRGHDDIVRRALNLFDRVIVAIGMNEAKAGLFSVAERMKQIEHYYRHNQRVRVICYNKLTVDVAQEENASVLVRGVRSGADVETERMLADLNRHIAGLETVILPASQQLTHVSSTVVRELLRYGRDVSDFLPRGFLL